MYQGTHQNEILWYASKFYGLQNYDLYVLRGEKLRLYCQPTTILTLEIFNKWFLLVKAVKFLNKYKITSLINLVRITTFYTKGLVWLFNLIKHYLLNFSKDTTKDF